MTYPIKRKIYVVSLSFDISHGAFDKFFIKFPLDSLFLCSVFITFILLSVFTHFKFSWAGATGRGKNPWQAGAYKETQKEGGGRTEGVGANIDKNNLSSLKS